MGDMGEEKRMTTLKDGEWIWRPIDQQWRNPTIVFTGAWERRKSVGKVSRMQAMALSRWHGTRGLFNSVKDGNGRWIDIRVAGDFDNFMRGGEQ
jgi:hypothetical protein